MKLKISRTDMWTVTIEDRAGGAAEKLEPLAKAGANFEFVFARRTPEQPGKGLLVLCTVLCTVKGAKVTRAAADAGFAKPDNLHAVRIEGADKPGTTAKITGAIAAAGINFRALSATAMGAKFVSYLAFDTADDAAKAVGVLKKLSRAS